MKDTFVGDIQSIRVITKGEALPETPQGSPKKRETVYKTDPFLLTTLPIERG